MGRLKWRRWLARLYAEGHAARRTALLAAMFLAVLALGAWGWVRVDHSSPTVSLGPLDAVYRSLQLFALAGGEVTPNPPIQLQLARFMAPATTAGALAVLLSTERLFHSVAARTAKRHVVAIGPVEEVAPFLPAKGDDRSVVHVVDPTQSDDEGRVRDAVRVVAARGTTDWIARSSARGAEEIVVATGDDAANLRILNDILGDGPAGEDGAGGRRGPSVGLEERLRLTAARPLGVTVVIGNRSTAITAAIQQAVADPERDVRVVCRWDRLVDAAVSDVLAGESELRPVALVGDGRRIGLFIWHLYRGLLYRYTQHTAQVRERLVLAATPRADRLVARLGDRPGLEVEVQDVAVLARSGPSLAVVFVGDDGSQASVHAYEWACRRPQDAVWFLSAESSAAADDWNGVGNLRAISALGRSTGSVLHDPWTRLAALYVERSAPGGPVGDAAPDPAAETVRAVRRAVRALAVQPGYRLEPSTGDEPPPGPLPSELATALADASGLEPAMCLELRTLLAKVDIVVHDDRSSRLAELRGGLLT